MAKRRVRTRDRVRRTIPERVRKHMARLALRDAAQYVAWCEARGFRTGFMKSWGELEREWSVHTRELAEARLRLRVDRDPGALLAAIAGGQARSSEVSRPHWRALGERIERARLDAAERGALRVVIEVANRRGQLVLAEGRYGDDAYPYLDGLIALARARHCWIREPREWRARSHNARRQFTSLVRHVVAKYFVPEFLDAAWLRSDAAAAGFRSWFLAVARGESIRHTAAPIPFTRRSLHHFLQAPADYAIEEAVRFGQVRAMGGSRVLVDAVLGSRIGTRFEHDGFWSTVLQFFVRHPGLERHVGAIVDYLHEQRFVSQEMFVAPGVRGTIPPAQPNLSMQGRSAESLLRQVERWHRELARTGAGGSAQWEASPVGELAFEAGKPGENLRIWRIRELRSAAELRAEGRIQRHCVASYTQACEGGWASIWTLERQGFDGIQKRLTIELRSGQRIVQCRGRHNRTATGIEREMVRRWAEQEGLEISKHAFGV